MKTFAKRVKNEENKIDKTFRLRFKVFLPVVSSSLGSDSAALPRKLS